MNISSCPICKQNLVIKEYYCNACNVSFHGEFTNSGLEELSTEQMDFVKLFLIVQGNIKEMEKRLGISYPTVKNRLGEIIRKISKQESSPTDYADIFNDLEEGFINVEEALGMIETRRKK